MITFALSFLYGKLIFSLREFIISIIYVLTNPAFENYVKIGKTKNLEQRLRSLDNTSVPLPFRCVYAVKVENVDKVEKLLHQTFADHRTRSTREFFEIDPQRVIAALKLTGAKDVTPRGDIAEDNESIEALQKAEGKKRRQYSLLEAGLKIGDLIYYVNDETITAEIISEKQISFEGGATSLSASALILLHRDGYTWKTVNGWDYWSFKNETIAERLRRLLGREDNED